MDRNFALTLVLYLVIAAVVYALLVQLAFWQVPRRRHVFLGTLVAFTGALVFGGAFERLSGGAPVELLGAVLGAVVFVFVAVKVGTPGSVVLTVDTEGVSGNTDDVAREGFEPPFVWPYHFNIEKFGTVIFDLLGKPGTEVTIEFPADNTPFGVDREGRPRTTFVGTVPGQINASPVVVASRGKFLIKKKDPETGETVVNDPTWDTPRRKD